MLLLRAHQPDRRGAGRGRRAGARTSTGAAGPGGAGLHAAARKMPVMRGGVRLPGQPARGPVPVLQPARGAGSGGPPAGSAAGDPAVPDRRAGSEAAGGRVAERALARSHRRCRAGPGAVAAARALRPVLDVRQLHSHHLFRPPRRCLVRDPPCHPHGQWPPGHRGRAGAAHPLDPGERPHGAGLRRCAGAGGRDSAAPPGGAARALGPRWLQALRRRLPGRLRERALPGAGGPGLWLGPDHHARGDHRRRAP